MIDADAVERNAEPEAWYEIARLPRQPPRRDERARRRAHSRGVNMRAFVPDRQRRREHRMHAVRTQLQKLTLAGPSGAVEALLEEPVGVARAGIAVVCHPHPLHGGTMQNKVAHTLARTFCGLGLTALRFNFRGVGASAGSYGGGAGELEDALAMLEWAAARQPRSALWLAGFSFGGCVALQASRKRPVRQLVAVAPAVERCAVDGAPPCPCVIVQGLEDELVDSGAVRAWAARMSGEIRVVELPGVDHFFHGRLGQLRQVIEAELTSAAATLPAIEPQQGAR
jgi:alpha/beta superfamily hydrolase